MPSEFDEAGGSIADGAAVKDSISSFGHDNRAFVYQAHEAMIELVMNMMCLFRSVESFHV